MSSFACSLSIRSSSNDQDERVRSDQYAGLIQAVEGKTVQASTSEVYENLEIYPYPEEYWDKFNPTGICSCYDED